MTVRAPFRPASAADITAMTETAAPPAPACAAPDAAACERGRTVMFHDGACPLCAIEVAHYRKADRDGAIAFIDADADEAALADAGLTREQALARLHVRLPDGRMVSGARAFVALWAALPGWRRLAPIAGAPPVIWLMEGVYRVFLPLRPAFARLARRLVRD